jgi:heme-degrading monooxygenase HmoA
MYAGVVTLRAHLDRVGEAVRIYRESVLPELKELQGFEGGYVLTNAESGKCYVIGLWHTQEDAKRFQSSGSFREQASKFEDVLAEAPSREIYEVSVKA